MVLQPRSEGSSRAVVPQFRYGQWLDPDAFLVIRGFSFPYGTAALKVPLHWAKVILVAAIVCLWRRKLRAAAIVVGTICLGHTSLNLHAFKRAFPSMLTPLRGHLGRDRQPGRPSVFDCETLKCAEPSRNSQRRRWFDSLILPFSPVFSAFRRIAQD
jgi:hypothetical protein